MTRQTRILKKKKNYRFSILLGMVVALIFAVSGGLIALFDESVREEARCPALVLFVGFPLGFTLLSLYALMENIRFRCFLEPHRIGLRSVFGEQWFRLPEITQVIWKQNQKMILFSNSKKMPISYSGLPINQQRHLILYLRRNIPQKLQEGWDHYCLRDGYQIMKSRKPKYADLKRELVEERENGQIRITRKRAWKIVFWITLYATLIGILIAVWFGSPQILSLVGVVFITCGVWASLHPSHGHKDRTLPASRKYWLVRVGGYTALIFYYCVLFKLTILFPEHGNKIMVFIMVQTYAPFLMFPLLAKRQRTKSEEVLSERKQQWKQIQEKYGI